MAAAGSFEGPPDDRLAERPEDRPRRPGLVIGPTTDDDDVQLEW
jgi:hypothetical protein